MDLPADIYSDEVFALVANSPAAPLLDAADGQCEKQAKLCGSKINVTVKLDEKGRIKDYGHQLEACLLGQTSAAVVASHAKGQSRAQIQKVRDDFEGLLKTGALIEDKDWQNLNLLVDARSYKMRHGSMLLVFDALLCAIDKAAGAA